MRLRHRVVRAWLTLRVLTAKSRSLRCGCHWTDEYGVVIAMGCRWHD